MPLEDPVMPLKAVAATAGVSKGTIYNLLRAGDFPKPIQISPARLGWRKSTVDAWLASRVRA
jgi:prophage regulatory protein